MAFGLRRTPPAQPKDGRRDERHDLQVPANILLATGDTREVMIENLSTTGFGAIGDLALSIGTVFRIGLTPGHARHARVVWIKAGHAGCEFLSPLSPGCPELGLDASAAQTGQDPTGPIS